MILVRKIAMLYILVYPWLDVPCSRCEWSAFSMGLGGGGVCRATGWRRLCGGGVRAIVVVVTSSFPEIFPQLSDRFNHKYPHNKF